LTTVHRHHTTLKIVLCPCWCRLWESATTTAGSLPARLAVEHCCHEARGLDVLPGTIAKFRNNGDEATAALLENVVYPVSARVWECAWYVVGGGGGGW
jgi:uncharacterized ferritin-like protein (DUF455 family)